MRSYAKVGYEEARTLVGLKGGTTGISSHDPSQTPERNGELQTVINSVDEHKRTLGSSLPVFRSSHPKLPHHGAVFAQEPLRSGRESMLTMIAA